MKYSIIIPAYNAEDTISHLLYTLLGQKFRGFEVIVVNDASTDSTLDILKSFSSKFREDATSFYIVDKPVNEGLSVARNTGLDFARGEYIIFLDSDDEIEPAYLRVIDSYLNEFPYDYVVYGISEDYYKKDVLTYSNKILPGYQAYYKENIDIFYNQVAQLEKKTLFGYAWNKIYRRKIIMDNQIRFYKIDHIEDVLFNIDYIKHIKSAVMINEVLYHYVNKEQDRLTTKVLEDYFELQCARIAALDTLISEGYTSNKRTLYSVMTDIYLRSFMSAMMRFLDEGESRRSIYNWFLEQTHSKLYKNLRYNKYDVPRLYMPIVKGKFEAAYRNAKRINFVKKHFKTLYYKAKQAR